MDERWLEKIEDYLNGRMTAEERVAFESEMADNEELSAAFRLYSSIELKMREFEYHIDKKAALKKTLERFGAQYSKMEMNDETSSLKPEETPTSKKATGIKRIKVWQWTVAASVAGIAILGVYFCFQKVQEKPTVAINNKKLDTSTAIAQDTPLMQPNVSSPDTAKQEAPNADKHIKTQQQAIPENWEALFAAYFVPDAPPDDEEGPLEDAFAYYESGAYKDAATAFEHADLNEVTRGAYDEELTASYANYYKALSYMAINNVAKAIPALKKVIEKSADSLLKIKAEWYLSLAHLKTNNLKKAEDLLTGIISNTYETTYKSKAAALLNKLKQQ